MHFAKYKLLSTRLRQIAMKSGALVVTASTVWAGAALAADGGSGSSGGSTGTGGYTSRVVWASNDNFGPANATTVENVLTGTLNGVLTSNSHTNVANAIQNANNECVTNYAARHNGDTASANCRVFAVGAVRTDQSRNIADATAGLTQAQWMQAWAQEVGPKTYTHNGVAYNTNARLSSGSTIDGLAARETNGGNRTIVVVVLAADQPKLWDFTPDKSWLTYTNGKWNAVVDNTWSNTTGADTHTVLDGTKLGAAINGTLAAQLGDSLTEFKLVDDYSKADYLFDADNNDIHVYAADVSDDSKPTVNDIVNHGQDVTSQFDITVNGTTVTASMKQAALTSARNNTSAKQYTLLVGGKANFANGKGAAQVRLDSHQAEGSEVTFCADPTTGAAITSHGLLNSGSVSAAGKSKKTNEPYICGYVPPVVKQVIGEASQGGDQASVDGKNVFPGQKLEYKLTTTPTIPQNLTETINTVAFIDQYDQYLQLDKQTIEVLNLTDGSTVTKNDYVLTEDKAAHTFTVTLKPAYVAAHFGAGVQARFQIRFEGTVAKNAPTNREVTNQWTLQLNNSVTPSNTVKNIPVDVTPTKRDETKTGINIDGKTVYYGDDVYYRLTLDAEKLAHSAYKIQRLGMVDKYDSEYLNLIDNQIEVLDSHGQDVTSKFNIQVKNGSVYVFFKTVDTDYLGDTLKGDPQPTDLEAYVTKALDPKTMPSIDQSVLGQKYTVVLPMKVAKVTDGYVVKNTATQITNERTDVTNTVTNPLKDINPRKDVTVNVNGDSVNGKSIYKNHQFLYKLDSSKITGNRAYQQIKNWKIVDKYDTRYDKTTGQWAVYANNNITDDEGNIVIAKGARIDGSGVGAGYFTFTDNNGVFTVEATQAFLDLASGMDANLSWTAYVQMTRTAVSDRVENRFVETLNDTERESNLVWTKTPDQTPAIKLIKYDAASGLTKGDRNTPAEALTRAKNGTRVVFRIINTGSVDLTKITLEDKTIAGNGTVTNLEYPAGWDTLILKPGQWVEVTGTLTGLRTHHTDRGTTTGTPIVPCNVSNNHPFDGTVTGDDKKGGMCYDTPVKATDDWNATTSRLATTGSTIIPFALIAVAAVGLGGAFIIIRKKTAQTTTQDEK
ncbi:LPXTG cell wall anchor domain-containing protein [Alloscardovia theropitheci]|nr:LPXTG cell wall anchor domain-containing protein [Alloscardovia theropitheci]